jgi:protein-S-isoprenylcysteine O-methyltransferase Ste14
MPRLIPPLLWLVCLASIVLAGLVPLSFPMIPAPFYLGGWGLFAAGLAVTVLASRQFKAAGTNIHTFRDPGTLVTSGLFAVSRNPMYLGFLVSLFGAAVGVNHIAALVPVVLFFLVSQLHYIPFEERAALRQFGAPYEQYRRSVRRWI